MACAHGGRQERVVEELSGVGEEWPQPGKGEGEEALEGEV